MEDERSMSLNSENISRIREEYEEINNNSFSINSTKFYSNKYNTKIKLKKRYFMCDNCKSTPKMIFKDNNIIDIICDCKEISNLRIKDFINSYSYHKREDVEYHLCCYEHKHNKYKCYCFVCHQNLCEECIKETFLHDNHVFNFFSSDINNKEIFYLNELIINKREKLTKGDNDIREKLNLFEALINSYKEFPCRNLYESIKNAKKFLESLNITETKERLKIRKEKELIEYTKKSNLIFYINISRQNFNDLSIFKGLDLSNLKILILNENCIQNIDPLLNCNFKELDNLELERNKLNYQSMKDFDKMLLPNIKYINLFRNEIETIKIFDKILNFKTLTKFHVGENKFEAEEIIKNANKKYDLSFLKNIGLTANFTEKTIFFALNLILPNIEFLYLNRNNLFSLGFLKDLECPNLISFWAIENHLIDYNDLPKLKYKDKIQRINLKDNKIKNIDNLLEFISEFPNLEYLVLVNNEINWNEKKNNKLIEEVNNKYKNLKLIFEINGDNKIYLQGDL